MPSADLDEIRRTHTLLNERLCGELKGVAKPFGGNTKERGDFVSGVLSLFSKIEREAEKNSTTVAEYDWLRNTLADWQFAMSSILGVAVTAPLLEYPRHLVEATMDNRVWRFLEKQAHDASEERREAKYRRVFGEAWHKENQWSDAERLSDWVDAEIFLACDVLSGSGAFWNDIPGVPVADRWKYLTPTVFDVLQKVWIDDVFRIRAYEIWREGGAIVGGHEEAKKNFQAARDECFSWIRDPQRKSDDPGARRLLSDYLGSSMGISIYDAASIDLLAPVMQDITRRKAEKIAKKRDQGEKRNWSLAERYVAAFYPAIVIALREQGPESKKRVGQAFLNGTEKEAGAWVINALEAAMLVYFIDDVNL